MDQFNHDFASHWDELVGWEKRSEENIMFIVKLLEKFNCNDILDVALGTGFHAISLLGLDFSVTGVDISQAMINIAKQNSIKHSVRLNVICSDWVNIQSKLHKKFDCIICLGNSFACENDKNKRKLSIENWSKLLNDNGIIIVDRRNYELLLKGDDIISSRKLYFGKSVKIVPKKITSCETIFHYSFSDGKTFKLQMYPILDNEIKSLFMHTGFSLVETYGDCKLIFDKTNVSIYHYIFRKN